MPAGDLVSRLCADLTAMDAEAWQLNADGDAVSAQALWRWRSRLADHLEPPDPRGLSHAQEATHV